MFCVFPVLKISSRFAGMSGGARDKTVADQYLAGLAHNNSGARPLLFQKRFSLSN